MAGGQEELHRRVGYELKRAQSALNQAMDRALRPHGLTVPQYACLELLDQQPDLSTAELARRAFVTRQSMNVVLRGLITAGLVQRPESVEHGRARPATLSPAGTRALSRARRAILVIEKVMLAPLSEQRAARLLIDLSTLTDALRAED